MFATEKNYRDKCTKPQTLMVRVCGLKNKLNMLYSKFFGLIRNFTLI